VGGSKGELRIGLTISGAIALGAYEGGALAALLCAAQAVNEEKRDALRIDAIAGASAGSITALLAVRTLLSGMDPVEAMYGAWVTTPQLDKLTDGSTSPLKVDRTRAEAERLLSGDEDPGRAQSTAIRVHMALGCLRGLDYSITRIAGPPVSASTYLDWGEFTVDKDKDVAWYTASSGPIDTALASGAHAAAFPPYGLDRSAYRRRYEDNGIEHFPDSGYLWYTDGGTIDNEPLGRALDLTGEIDSADPIDDAGRLHLLITPDPARPANEDGPWATAEPPPSWAKTGLQTIKLVRSQRLYDDLRRVEKTNSRIAWVRQLEEGLLAVMRDGGDPETALKDVTDKIKYQRDHLGESGDFRPPEEQSEPAAGIEGALRDALDAATGLSKKRDVSVAVVSPLLIPDVANGNESPHDVLAGEFLGHFGGFLDERLRESDFALGYDCMVRWLEGDAGLADHGLDPILNRTAIKGARAGQKKLPTRPGGEDFGRMTFKRLRLGTKLRLYGVALRSAWIAFQQARKPGD
jgi:hypothetical protein